MIEHGSTVSDNCDRGPAHITLTFFAKIRQFVCGLSDLCSLPEQQVQIANHTLGSVSAQIHVLAAITRRARISGDH